MLQRLQTDLKTQMVGPNKNLKSSYRATHLHRPLNLGSRLGLSVQGQSSAPYATLRSLEPREVPETLERLEFVGNETVQ